jgi:hypothetical protein
MPGSGEDKLEPRIQEVLDAISDYKSSTNWADRDRLHRHMHHLLIRLTVEEFDQVRFICAEVGGRDC